MKLPVLHVLPSDIHFHPFPSATYAGAAFTLDADGTLPVRVQVQITNMAPSGLGPRLAGDFTIMGKDGQMPGSAHRPVTSVYLHAEWKSNKAGPGGRGEIDTICPMTEYRSNVDSQEAMVRLFKCSAFLNVVLGPLLQRIHQAEADHGRADADQVEG